MTSPPSVKSQGWPVTVGRYVLFEPIASGGMASVHIGRLLGSFGFSRTVAIKRLHESMAFDPEFLAMFLEEARLAARIRHGNVVQTLDVVAMDNELLLVMEYISGAALSRILNQNRKAERHTPHRVAVDIIVGVLNGLHAAHEAKDENGEPLHIVHRDVSPQNILIGTDGVARLLDFGIAKAKGGSNVTRPNQIKGKARYLSPETLTARSVTRASDIYSASVVLWEMLAGRRLFDASNARDVIDQVLNLKLMAPSQIRPHIARKLDEIVMRGLSRDPAARYATAREMALALEAAVTPVNGSAVADWAVSSVGEEIRERDNRVAQIEREAQGDGNGSASAQLDERAEPRERPPQPQRFGSTETTVKTGRVRHAAESGSAPSLALLIEHPNGSTAPARGRRTRVVAALAGIVSSLFLGGVWFHSASTTLHDAQPAPVSTLATVPTVQPSQAEPTPSTEAPQNTVQSPPLPASPAGSAGALVPPPAQSPRLTASAPNKQPNKHHAVSAGPKKLTADDRIYRRD
jgi:eukaryotic-like serine/threonine-protein kinase